MSEDDFILLSLNDEISKDLANVLNNKICKKIISFLTENKSASAKDIADGINIGLNLVDYNVKKLLKSRLVEKDKKFFWSKKGKKIVLYKVSNKSVVISPKNEISSKLKNLIPAALLIGASTFAVYVYEKIRDTKVLVQEGMDAMAPSLANKIYEEGASGEIARVVTEEIVKSPSSPIWPWFLFGAILTLTLFSILNWKRFN